MSLGLAEFTYDPAVSYLQRVLIRSNVTSELSNFCLRLYRADQLVETICFDWAEGIRLPKRKSYVYFHFVPQLSKSSELESRDKQWIVNFCPQNPALQLGDTLEIKLGFVDELMLQSD